VAVGQRSGPAQTPESGGPVDAALIEGPLLVEVVDLACTGSEDTELGVLMEPEVGQGGTEVYTRVQA
jgi:hypothetical protein